MALTAQFGSFSKRRNSTKRPASFSDVRTITLKNETSHDAPVFTLTGNSFNYNYCIYDGCYYFIDDIISLHNNLIEVHCIMDPLATYKDEILASTQYVAYSSVSGGAWLPDTRIPVMKNTIASKNTASLAALFNINGFYVLTAVGKNGCTTYAMDLSDGPSGLYRLLDRLNDWSDDLIDDILAGNYPWTDPASPQQAVTYDWTNAPEEALANMAMLTGIAGNAYQDAPSCIRSCIWVPFYIPPFIGASKQLFLGQFDTQMTMYTVKADPVTGSVTVNIPWHFSDWRRGYCEDVYIYLPLVGIVALNSDNLTQAVSLTIKYSATATDGCISYQVLAGNQIIGSYGGQCSANFPIGISQQASAGQIAQTAFEGAHRTVNAGFSAASQLNPISWAGGIADVSMTAVETAYSAIDTMLTRNNTCIGGVGGGAGAGLDLDITCYTVAHDTVVNPSDMLQTMGIPTMKPLQLSNCSGYCQCVNAHVDAPATAGELNAIDAMLNSGFYIE